METIAFDKVNVLGEKSGFFDDERAFIILSVNELLMEEYESTPIYPLIKPYFGSKGKKLRPLLAIFLYRLFKGDEADLSVLKPILAALEITHNASLIVDDVFDKDLVRRGEESFFVKHGTFAALAIAYNLTAFVFELTAQVGITDTVKALGRAGADLSSALYLSKDLVGSKPVSEEYFMSLLHKKTSSLFIAAANCAAVLVSDDLKMQQNITEFGKNFGAAYQLRDDVLAIEGDFEDLGKEPDSDILNRLQSLITIKAMELGSPAQVDLLQRYYFKREDIDSEVIRQTLIESGGIAAVKKECLAYAQKCHAFLDKSPQNNTNKKLKDLLKLINFD